MHGYNRIKSLITKSNIPGTKDILFGATKMIGWCFPVRPFLMSFRPGGVEYYHSCQPQIVQTSWTRLHKTKHCTGPVVDALLPRGRWCVHLHFSLSVPLGRSG